MTRQWLGVYIGRVTKTRGDLWVKLQVPQILGRAETNWAAPAGFNTGTPPVAGSIVLAMFVGGDPNTPCYLLTDQKLR